MIAATSLRLVLAASAAVCPLAGVDESPAAPHPGPPVYVECEVDDTSIEFRFTGEQNSILLWLRGPDAPSPDAPDQDGPDGWMPDHLEAPLTPGQIDTLTGEIRSFFDGQPPITVDDEPAEFTVRGVEVPDDDVTGYGTPAIQFVLHFARSEAPRRIGIEWRTWRRLTWYDATRLPVMFRAFGDTYVAFLSPDEPGHVWHSESMVPREPPVIVEVTAPPPERLPVSLLMVGCGVAALGTLVLALRGTVRWPVWLAFAAGMAASGWFGRGLWTVEVDNPFVPEVAAPSDDEARAIFERLHRNIYSSFDARSEREIYELLLRSVTPNLLDELYGEIYEALVLRGEGGAVCQIEGYDVVDSEVYPDPEADPWETVPELLEDRPRFELRWSWELRGLVSHWGHEHRRLNRYEADYVVLHDGTSWKIAYVDILDHERVDREDG